MLFQSNLFEKKVGSLKQITMPKNIKKIVTITEKVNNLLPEKIKENECLHYASCSDFSMHDVLFRIIELYGKIKHLYLATWSISNNAAEMLIKAKDEGIIENIHLLLDWRVQVRTPKAKGLLNYNKVDMKICNCHAKVFCVETESGEKIVMLGSANLTNNPRIEAGIITQSENAYNFHKGWIESEMANAKPFGIDTAKLKSGRDIGENDE